MFLIFKFLNINIGTDNGQADTTLNQAGLWGLSFTNYAIGNRFANNYNGMLYQEQGFDKGRGHVNGMLCPALQQMGRLEVWKNLCKQLF